MKKTLIISDYDMGYTFSVYWNGKIYYRNDGKLLKQEKRLCDYCFNLMEKPQMLKIALEEIDIYPKRVIVCSDGCIDIYN